MERAPWPLKLSGPHRDVERDGNSNHRPQASWQVPQTWKEAGNKSFDDYDGDNLRQGSESTLQPLRKTHTQPRHGE